MSLNSWTVAQSGNTLMSSQKNLFPRRIASCGRAGSSGTVRDSACEVIYPPTGLPPDPGRFHCGRAFFNPVRRSTHPAWFPSTRNPGTIRQSDVGNPYLGSVDFSIRGLDWKDQQARRSQPSAGGRRRSFGGFSSSRLLLLAHHQN